MKARTVGLGQTDVSGLSESWLFKHAGDRHWRRLCAALGAAGIHSERLRDDSGRRLYPAFVAVRARYRRPLAAIGLDAPLATRAALARYGRSLFRSRVTVTAAGAPLRLEMLTSFAARAGGNRLAASSPVAPEPWRVARLRRLPPLLRDALEMRRGRQPELELAGRRLRPRTGDGAEPAASALYEPSPYSDYNGAGLLYFAAYPTIADTVERRLLRAAGAWNGRGDWSLVASPVARDVFYYGNLELGRPLRVELRLAERDSGVALSHVRLADEDGERALADVITLKRLLVDD